MSSNNRLVKVKRGETGFILNARLKADDNSLINLAAGGNWTVTIKVTVRGSTTNLLQGSSMTPRDQNTHRGQAYYVFTAADALIAAGNYDLEIIAVEPGGRVHRFPKKEGSVFGTLRMMESKYA